MVITFEEIAPIVGRSPSAARQHLSGEVVHPPRLVGKYLRDIKARFV